MSTTTAQAMAQPQLQGNVLLYSKPEPLSATTHAKLGLKNIAEPFGFIKTTHVVPLTVNEFGMAATCFPIIFANDKKTPLAVMAARSGENLFVDAGGQVDPDMYIPAFVRRYPFVFAAENGGDNLLVCIDTAAPMIGENPDLPLFENGQPTKYTNDAIEFLQEFERQRAGTDQFTQIIGKYDLMEEKTVTFSPNNPDGSQGEPQKIADYWGVSEDKLRALPVEAITELRDTGALAAIYAHLVSLLQWQKLVQMTLRRAQPN
jgi:hypothetical protein